MSVELQLGTLIFSCDILRLQSDWSPSCDLTDLMNRINVRGTTATTQPGEEANNTSNRKQHRPVESVTVQWFITVNRTGGEQTQTMPVGFAIHAKSHQCAISIISYHQLVPGASHMYTWKFVVWHHNTRGQKLLQRKALPRRACKSATRPSATNKHVIAGKKPPRVRMLTNAC